VTYATGPVKSMVDYVISHGASFSIASSADNVIEHSSYTIYRSVSRSVGPQLVSWQNG